MLEALDPGFKQLCLVVKALTYGKESPQHSWAMKSDGNPKMSSRAKLDIKIIPTGVKSAFYLLTLGKTEEATLENFLRREIMAGITNDNSKTTHASKEKHIFWRDKAS